MPFLNTAVMCILCRQSFFLGICHRTEAVRGKVVKIEMLYTLFLKASVKVLDILQRLFAQLSGALVFRYAIIIQVLAILLLQYFLLYSRNCDQGISSKGTEHLSCFKD